MFGAQSSVGVLNQIYEASLDGFLFINCWIKFEFCFLIASDLLFSFLLLSDAVILVHVEAAIGLIQRSPWAHERFINSANSWFRSQFADILNIRLILRHSKSLKPSLFKFDLIIQKCFWASHGLCFEIFLGVLVGQIARLSTF